MARYMLIDTNPRLLPVNLAAQLLPGNFEHAVDHLLDHAIVRSRFDARFRIDTTGAPAYGAGGAAQGRALRVRGRDRQQSGHDAAVRAPRDLDRALRDGAPQFAEISACVGAWARTSPTSSPRHWRSATSRD
jgi:hypothetical protein